MFQTESKTNPSLAPVAPAGSRASQRLLFHEPWWLSAAAGERHIQLSVVRGDHLSGHLSLMMTTSKFGFRVLRLPFFTNVLGPMIVSGTGKRQKRLANRLSIIRELIDQLPAYDFCQVSIDPSLDDGLALADGLPFQERGFRVAPQYTFQINCQNALEELWGAMDFKVRQHIRRAEERYTIAAIDDPHKFINFYLDNLKKRGRRSYFNFERFPTLFSECNARTCGIILAALLPDGSPVAMTYIVWGHGMLYYTLSTRVPDAVESGSVNLLIWSAMKKAHELGLICDLDGVVSQGTARFLGGFGGEIRVRSVATLVRPVYGALQYVARKFDPVANEASKFT
jgi:hypothetical protein